MADLSEVPGSISEWCLAPFFESNVGVLSANSPAVLTPPIPQWRDTRCSFIATGATVARAPVAFPEQRVPGCPFAATPTIYVPPFNF
jgi:hypothetical protein